MRWSALQISYSASWFARVATFPIFTLFRLEAVTLWYFQLIFLTRYWQMVDHLNLQPKKKGANCFVMNCQRQKMPGFVCRDYKRMSAEILSLAASSGSKLLHNFVTEKRKCQMFLSWRRERASTGPRSLKLGLRRGRFALLGTGGHQTEKNPIKNGKKSFRFWDCLWWKRTDKNGCVICGDCEHQTLKVVHEDEGLTHTKHQRTSDVSLFSVWYIPGQPFDGPSAHSRFMLHSHAPRIVPFSEFGGFLMTSVCRRALVVMLKQLGHYIEELMYFIAQIV